MQVHFPIEISCRSIFPLKFHLGPFSLKILGILTGTTYQINDNKFIMRVFALDISNAFDKMYHWGLQGKLSSYGIFGKVFTIINSFLSSRSMKVVFNGHSSEAHNVGIPYGSLLGQTFFWLYINNLLKILNKCLWR